MKGNAPRRRAVATAVALAAGWLTTGTAHADPLPDCPPIDLFDAYQPEFMAGGRVTRPHQDCRLRSDDPVGLRFEVRWRSRKAEIEVDDRAGGRTQTITEEFPEAEPDILFGFMQAGLVDADGDGRDELAVPTGARLRGGVSWIFYRAVGDAARLRRQPEMFAGKDSATGIGSHGFGRTDDGFLMTVLRADNARHQFDFYTTGEPDFVHVITVLADDWPDASGHRRRCGLPEEPGSAPDLAALGMDEATAVRTFCAKIG